MTRAIRPRNTVGLDVSERRVIDTLDAVLPEILWGLSDPTTEIELSLAV